MGVFIDELNELKEQDDIDEETKGLIEKDLEKLYGGLEYMDWLSRGVNGYNGFISYTRKLSI